MPQIYLRHLHSACDYCVSGSFLTWLLYQLLRTPRFSDIREFSLNGELSLKIFKCDQRLKVFHGD
jgi:hypothetical protein